MSYTKYPNNIDTSTELPKATDNVTPIKAEIVNRLRDAVLAIETELGVKPSSVYGTLKDRLDAMDGYGGGGGGTTTSNSLDVNKASHGFITGQAIYFDGADWLLAQSNDGYTLGIAVVEKIDDDNFKAVFGGVISGLTGFTSVGEFYFVSDSVAGLLTITEPTDSNSYSNPLLLLLSDNDQGLVLNFRASAISGGGGAGPTGPTGATGDNGFGYNGLTSTTTISSPFLGSQSFTTNLNDTQTAFVVGSRIRAITGGGAVYLDGTISSFSGTSLTVLVDETNATIGSFSSWTFSITGSVGAIGAIGATGATGATGASSTSSRIIALDEHDIFEWNLDDTISPWPNTGSAGSLSLESTGAKARSISGSIFGDNCVTVDADSEHYFRSPETTIGENTSGTVHGWVKLASENSVGNVTIISKDGATEGPGPPWYGSISIRVSDNYVFNLASIIVTVGDAHEIQCFQSSGKSTQGWFPRLTWTHIALTWDSGVGYIYVNGRLCTITASYSTITWYGKRWKIGYGSTYGANADYSKWRVCDIARSPQYINEVYRRGVGQWP